MNEVDKIRKLINLMENAGGNSSAFLLLDEQEDVEEDVLLANHPDKTKMKFHQHMVNTHRELADQIAHDRDIGLRPGQNHEELIAHHNQYANHHKEELDKLKHPEK